MNALKVRVSAIIPTYNNEKTLGRAIDSALIQDFDEPFEVIVVNDGSTDSTAKLLAGYGTHIRTIYQQNRGAAVARNTGARAATGEYLAFLDADDEWLPQKMRITAAALADSPDAVLAYSDFICVDINSNRTIKSPLRGSPTLEDLLNYTFGFFPTVIVMRRSVFEALGGFCEEFNGAGFEDSYLALVAREQGEFVHIAQPLAIYYESSATILAAKYRRGLRILVRLARERYGPRSRNLVSGARSFYASLLVTSAIDKIKRKSFGGAFVSFVRAAKINPRYVLTVCTNRIRKSAAS